MDDVSRFCLHHGANEAILRALIASGDAFALRAYLSNQGIADDPPTPPKAEPAQAAKPEPAQPPTPAKAATEPDTWAETNRRTGIITCLEAQRRQGFARYLADHTNLTVDQARGALALVPCEPLPAWGAGPEPVAVVPVRPDQAAHPGSQAGIDDVWARAVAAVNRGG